MRAYFHLCCRNIGIPILSILLALYTPSTTYADEPTLVASEITDLFEEDKTGFYDQALSLIFVEANIKVPYDVLPPARAEAMFRKQEADCWTPNSLQYLQRQDSPFSKEDILISKPINFAKVFIFSRTGDPKYNSIEALKPLTVGKRLGLTYSNIFSGKGITFEETKTLKSNIQRLLDKRVNAIVAYAPDIFLVLKEMNAYDDVHYDASAPLSTVEDAIICHNTSKNKAFLSKFNLGLEQVRASGKLKQALGIMYVTP